MTKDDCFDVISAAQAIRTESEMLSDLLSRGEVLSDHRLSAHYETRLRRMQRVLDALKAWERDPSDERTGDLRREVILYRLSENDAPRVYAGAGVYVRTNYNKDQDAALDLLAAIAGRAGLSYVLREKNSDLRVEMMGERAYPLLSSLERGSLGDGVTFAVYPIIEVGEVREEDVRTDIFLNGGKGGQNVNKVETAVRMTHLPTGVTVTCRDERSQLQNKKRAAKLLRAAVARYYAEAQSALIEEAQRSLRG